MFELSQYDTFAPVDLRNPVNKWNYLNRGLVSWFLCLPGLSGGQYWYDLMNKNKGTLTSMGNGNNGWRSAGSRKGGFGSLLFDGSAGYVAAPINLNLITTLTISCWLRVDVLPPSGTYQFISNDIGSFGRVLALTNTNWQILNTQGFYQIATTAVAGQWIHVTGSWSTSATILYLNGAVVISNSGESATYNDATSLEIGRNFGGPDYLNGAMDDIRIWNRVLSALDVQTVYNESKAGYPFTLNRVVNPVCTYQNPTNGFTVGANYIVQAYNSNAFPQYQSKEFVYGTSDGNGSPWVEGIVVSGSTNVLINTTRTEADHFWDGAYISFTSGTLKGITSKIVSYSNTNGACSTTLSGLPATPAAGDSFVIMGRN